MIDKIFRGIRKAELLITSVVFLSALAVLTVNVVLRQLSGLGALGAWMSDAGIPGALTWAEEFMRYAIIWVTFVGCALCAEDDLHVGIDIFIQMSPPVVRKWLKVAGMLCSTFFSAYMVQFSFRNTMLLVSTGQKTAITQIPMAIVYVSMPIGMLLTTLMFGRKLVTYLRMKPADFADKPKDGDAGDIDLLQLN